MNSYTKKFDRKVQKYCILKFQDATFIVLQRSYNWIHKKILFKFVFVLSTKNGSLSDYW